MTGKKEKLNGKARACDKTKEKLNRRAQACVTVKRKENRSERWELLPVKYGLEIVQSECGSLSCFFDNTPPSLCSERKPLRNPKRVPPYFCSLAASMERTCSRLAALNLKLLLAFTKEDVVVSSKPDLRFWYKRYSRETFCAIILPKGSGPIGIAQGQYHFPLVPPI